MPEELLSKFPHFRDVAMHVAKLVNNVRSYLSCDQGLLEIEVRMGRHTSTGFDANVGNQNFCSILGLLDSYQRWTRVSPWQETHDVYYSVKLPHAEGERAVQVRTSVGVNATGDIEISHTHKRRIDHLDMELHQVDSGSCSVNVNRTDQGFDARVAASVEQNIPAELLPIAVSPELVRIKQRKRYFLGSLGVNQETFSFDLSIVYSGATKSEAEQRQSAQKSPTYEIEIECLQPGAYLHSAGGEDIMLALSLVMKAHDFASAIVPDQTVTYMPVASR